MTEFCARCEHSEEEHDALGLCEVPHCPCVCFVGDMEDEEDDVDELNFDGQGD